MTKEDIEQIKKLIEPLKQGQEHLEKRIDTLDMKIEANFIATNTKLDQRSEQIMDCIADTATEILKEQNLELAELKII